MKDKQDDMISQMIESDGSKKSDTLEIPSVEQQLAENVKTYGGAKNNNNLTWIYDDETKLPQFSAQSKIETLLDKYLDVLNSKNIPENIKLKLATLFKTRYDRTRKPELYRDDDYDQSDENQDDINLGNTQYAHYSGPQLAIALILSNASLVKLPLIRKFAAELMKHTRYINWNYKGILTHPDKYRFSPHIDIARFIDIIISKDEKPTDTEKSIILNIVRPFYRDIKPHVKNTVIRQTFNLWDVHQGQSTSTRPKRFKKTTRTNTTSPPPPTLSPQNTPRRYETF